MKAETIGQRLRSARLKAGFYTARTAAEELGVTPNTYYRYERDESTPPYKVLSRLAELFKVPLSELLEDGDAPTVARPPYQPGFSEPQPLLHAGRDPGDYPDATGYCSVLAWKLANDLSDQMLEQHLADQHSRPRLTAELYFALTTSPASALTPYKDVLSLNQELWDQLSHYLSVYHSVLEKTLRVDGYPQI
jgi:transcriptional regulator with XRE-family HTH domain